MQRSEQQLPSVSSESFYEPHSVHLSETKDEEKALAAFKNKQDVREVGGETKTNKTKTKINRPRNKLEQKLVVEQSSENKINPLRNKLELTKIAGQSLQKEISELLDELEQKRIAEESSETEINGLPNELKQEGIVEQMSKTEINRLRGKLEQERICFDQPQSQIENEWVINSRDIHVSGEKLGEGAWGIVYKGKFHGCGVAVKQFQEAINNASRRLFTREVNMASKCRHPCLLLFIGAIMDERPSLVIELMECSLRSKLFPDRGEEMLAKADESVISLDVALALHYLHEKKPHPILHNDVSSSNVLLWRSATHWRAKLSDYGSANIVRLTNLNCAGAAVYCAPKFTDADAVISCKVSRSVHSVVPLFL